jgi:hypothetical protein
MKITIESTDRVCTVYGQDGTGIPARVWEGETDSGIFVQCLVTRIAAPNEADLEQFQRELAECRPPDRMDVFHLNMVI